MAGETAEQGDLQLLLDDTTISSSNLGPRESDLLRSMSDDLLVSEDPIPIDQDERSNNERRPLFGTATGQGNYRPTWYYY